MPPIEEVTTMTNKPWTSVHPGFMPPALRVEEFRHYPSHAEVRRGHAWHTIPVETVTIESARGGRVTIGISGTFGDDDGHLYELDLTAAAAEELALRLICRAHDIRAAIDAEGDDA